MTGGAVSSGGSRICGFSLLAAGKIAFFMNFFRQIAGRSGVSERFSRFRETSETFPKTEITKKIKKICVLLEICLQDVILRKIEIIAHCHDAPEKQKKLHSSLFSRRGKSQGKT